MKKIILALSALVLITSCSNTDDNSIIIDNSQEGKPYANGIIVCNEGNFTRLNASISFINNSSSTITNDIFASNNSNAKLGDVAQFIGFKGDLAFIVVNNSNIIEIVNRYTFKKVGQITENLKQPRAIAFTKGKIYVSNAQSKTVTVYNDSNYAFEKTIQLDYLPEKLVANSNYVYVQSANYAEANVVEIINASTDTNTVDLTFDLFMNGIVMDNNQAVYVVGSDNAKSEISKIENTSVTKKITSTTVNSSRNLSFDNNNLYFTSLTGIYTISTTLNSFPSTPLFSIAGDFIDYYTLYGFNVIDGKVYTSDVKGFVDNSEVVIYNLSGNKLKTFTSQIGTNGFYKN